MKIAASLENYLPLSAPLCFECTEVDPSAETLVDVVDRTADRVVGRKRFRGLERFTVDVAPALRSCIRCQPLDGPTGWRALPERSVSGTVRCGAVEGPWYCFLPSIDRGTPLRMLSDLPADRVLGPAEREEAAFLAPGGEFRARLQTTRTDGVRHEERYEGPVSSFHTAFVLDAAELCERFGPLSAIAVDLFHNDKPLHALRYTVQTPPVGAQRLAWINRYGAVDAYTFPSRREERIEVQRDDALTAGSVRAEVGAARRIRVVETALMEERLLRALTDLPLSCRLWADDGGVWRPVRLLGEGVSLRSDDEAMTLRFTVDLGRIPTVNV